MVVAILRYTKFRSKTAWNSTTDLDEKKSTASWLYCAIRQSFAPQSIVVKQVKRIVGRENEKFGDAPRGSGTSSRIWISCDSLAG